MTGNTSRRKGGKRPRQKSGREERAIVNSWRDRGFACERVPLSGSAGGSFSGDIKLWTMFGTMTFESKARKNGFRRLYDWLGDHDALCLKADGKQRLYVLTEERLAEILAEAEGP